MKSVPVEKLGMSIDDILDAIGSTEALKDREWRQSAYSLLSQALQAARIEAKEEERKTATTEINSIYDYLLGTDSLPWEEDVEEMRKKSLSIINKHQ